MISRRAGALTEAQVLKVIDACSCDRDRALIALLYYYGLRISEGVSIETRVVSPKAIEIFRGKGSISGAWPMLPKVWQHLEPWLAALPPSKYLFPGRDLGSHLTRRQAYNVVVEACSRAGVPKSLAHPHIFKHSIISHLTGRIPPAAVQRWVGHRTGKVFEGYIDRASIPLDEAEAALK